MTSAPELRPEPEPDEPREGRLARAARLAPLAAGEMDDRVRIINGLYRASDVARKRSRWYQDIAEQCVRSAEEIEQATREVPHD